MAIRIVDSAETYRLIADDCGRWAVVEVRCGHAYSLDSHHSRVGDPTPAGITYVVGDKGWCDEDCARRCFDDAVKGERRYSEVIW